MESIPDTKWDVVISGTGFQQSLLALALSRSGKNILHVDPHDYYGGSEAAFSLKEVDEWAERYRAADQGQLFAAAEVRREDDENLSAQRSYNFALAPQLIHARSKLLSQLVDSKAFRQVEFLAVGPFFIYQPASESSPASLSRIPSTREDVFSNTAIQARAKRSLMKFLKFVLDFEAEPQTTVWQPHGDSPLADFLASEFKFDTALQSYIITLTLSQDGKVSVKDGLNIIHRHLRSMGVFGPGFAAVYPKWGGLSDVAQVGCRAAAVGGAVYMLGTDITEVTQTGDDGSDAAIRISLANDMVVKTKLLIQGSSVDAATEGRRISRLVAITKADLSSAFQVTIDGAPTPAVATVAFPPGSVAVDGTSSTEPIYAMIHTSETGECPCGQYVIYLSTIHSAASKALLDMALASLLAAVAGAGDDQRSLYQLYYEQRDGPTALHVKDNVITFPSAPLDLVFNDQVLEPVQEAWKMVMGPAAEADGVEYMKFQDREGQGDDDAYEYD